jgi:hypothetical protein
MREEEGLQEVAWLKAKLLTEGVNVSTGIERATGIEFTPKPKLPLGRIPSTLFLHRGGKSAVVEVRVNPLSPITLDVIGNRVIARKHSELIEGIELPRLPRIFTKRLKCGLKVYEIFKPYGDRVDLYLCDGCWFYGIKGYACNFCRPFAGTGTVRPRAVGWSESTWERYKLLVAEASTFLAEWPPSPHRHFLLAAGALPDYDRSWELALKLMKIINEYVDTTKIDSYINLMPPNDFRLIDKAANFFRNCMFNLEVHNRHIFNDICKGKAVTYGYDKIIESLKYAVGVFGSGNVRTNFVLGAEPLESLLEGAEELASIGVCPSATVFWPKPGSPWERKAPPTLSEVVAAYRALGEIYRRYGFKPFCCELGSRSSLENEAWKGWV